MPLISLTMFSMVLFVTITPTARAVDFECGTYSSGNYNDDEQCSSSPTALNDNPATTTTTTTVTATSNSTATIAADVNADLNNDSPSTSTNSSAPSAATADETAKSPANNTPGLFYVWGGAAVAVSTAATLVLIRIKRRK